MFPNDLKRDMCEYLEEGEGEGREKQKEPYNVVIALKFPIDEGRVPAIFPENEVVSLVQERDERRSGERQVERQGRRRGTAW